MSRIEAWNFMKKLNDGTATLVVRQKIENNENHHEKKVPPPPDTTTVSKSNGNQEQMTSVEQKEPEKLEAKRWKIKKKTVMMFFGVFCCTENKTFSREYNTFWILYLFCQAISCRLS